MIVKCYGGTLNGGASPKNKTEDSIVLDIT